MTPAATTRETIEAVARIYEVTLADIESGSRRRPVVRARHHAAAVLRLRERKSLRAIGLVLGIDHSSVPYAVGAHLSRARREHERARAYRRKRDLEKAKWQALKAAGVVR